MNDFVDSNTKLVSEDIPVHTEYSDIFSSRKEADDYIHDYVMENIFNDKLNRTYDFTSTSSSHARVMNEWGETILSFTIYELVKASKN